MKITQALIDQASMIANAKVGDELEESTRHAERWDGDFKGAVALQSNTYRYRIKPQPRVVYVNIYHNGAMFSHATAEAAVAGAGIGTSAIAVPYQQIGEGEKPA